jgi:hypothetical protein
LLGSIALFVSLLGIDFVRCNPSITGIPRDGKVPILPSTSRRGTTLNTSVALDSPSVMSKLLTPPHAHATHTATSGEFENASDNFDDASTVLDESGSLGSFPDATIARTKQMGNTVIPVSSHESRECPSDDLEETYIELNNEFIEEFHATSDASAIKNLLARRAIKYKLSPDTKFATSSIEIRDKNYDFSLDLSYRSIVEKEPFCGTENESAIGHMNELSALSNIFSDDIKKRTYFVTKKIPFSLTDEAKAWFNYLSPGSIDSPIGLVNAFFQKYFPTSAQHAALHIFFDFEQVEGEKLPESWARFYSLIRAWPRNPLAKNELLDIFYNGLTVESRTCLDSCAGCVFKKRTPAEAEELMAKISKNYDDWNVPEPTPAPTPKKREMTELNDEVMREAKKSLKEKGIKSEDVKNLPPIEELCKPIPRSYTIEVHSLQCFDNRDIPYPKPPDQCLDEFDNFIVKQDNFNKKVQNHLLENSRAINKLHDIVERTSNDVRMLVKHFQMV